MNPAVITPARQATRNECRLHALMGDLAAAGRFADAQACRDELRGVSARRSALAAIELRREQA